MEQVFRTFGLYDLVAYLIPGCVTLGSLLLAAIALRRSRRSPLRLMARLMAPYEFLVAAYIVGHIVQAVASPERCWNSALRVEAGKPTLVPVPDYRIDFFYADPTHRHDAFRAELRGAVNAAFSTPDPRDAFATVEAYVRVRGLSSFSDIMRARYAFFRGLFLSLFVAGVAFLFAAYCSLNLRVHAHSRHRRAARALAVRNGVIAALCFVAVAVAQRRTIDFARYYADSVYRAFYVDYLHPRPAVPDGSVE